VGGPVPVGVGEGDVDDGVGEGDGEAPFWTKMVTVVPFGAVLFAFGC